MFPPPFSPLTPTPSEPGVDTGIYSQWVISSPAFQQEIHLFPSHISLSLDKEKQLVPLFSPLVMLISCGLYSTAPRPSSLGWKYGWKYVRTRRNLSNQRKAIQPMFYVLTDKYKNTASCISGFYFHGHLGVFILLFQPPCREYDEEESSNPYLICKISDPLFTRPGALHSWLGRMSPALFKRKP